MTFITTCTDAELSAALGAILDEEERRRRLVSLPEQVAAMAAQYVDDGGDKAVLIDALTAEA